MHLWPDTRSLTISTIWSHFGLLGCSFRARWNKNKPKSLHNTDEAKCVSTYIQSDPLLNTCLGSKSALDFKIYWTFHLSTVWSMKLSTATSHHCKVNTTSTTTMQHSVCGGKKSDHLCDLISLRGIVWYQSPHVCPTCDQVAPCKHCYMWSGRIFSWLHFVFRSPDHESQATPLHHYIISRSKRTFVRALSLSSAV